MSFSKEEENRIIEEYSNGISLAKISEKFNSYPIKIKQLLIEKGIRIIGYKDRFPRDSDFFECVDTKEKAYWLGFLYADGCLTKGNAISITSIDKAHLIKFRNALKNNNKISISIDKRFHGDKVLYHYNIRDKKMYNDLIKWGCIPNKSLLLESIPNIPIDFKMDFIRGYFDGDGSLHYIQNYKKTQHKNFRLSFLGTKKFLGDILLFLGESKKKIYRNKDCNVYYCQFFGNQRVLLILDKLYLNSSESIRLDRKYDIYLQLRNYVGASPLN